MAIKNGGSDIFPSYIMETTNSDGSRSVSAIYTLEAIANQYLFLILLTILLGAFLTPFAAFFLAILYISSPNKNVKLFPILGILICGYLLFDITHSWPISIIINFFAHPIEKLYIIRGTVTMLLVNSVLLLVGNTLFNLAGRNSVVLFLYVLVITLFSYLIGTHILLNLFPIKFV